MILNGIEAIYRYHAINPKLIAKTEIYLYFPQNMCHSLGIWKEYSFYLDRIAHNHVRVFLIFHWFICLFHCSILLLLCDVSKA